RVDAVSAQRRRARKAEREGGKRTNAYRAHRKPIKFSKDQDGKRRGRFDVFRGKQRGETIACVAPRRHLSLSLAYVAPRRHPSLSLSLLSFHHIRIQWLDGSQPSEKKKREISESDPFHALKSFSAVTDNDSRAGIRRPSRL
ncbi:unnamed protein product, partial [Musa acuminata var. zebrina]